jgi:hypothetical protein
MMFNREQEQQCHYALVDALVGRSTKVILLRALKLCKVIRKIHVLSYYRPI